MNSTEIKTLCDQKQARYDELEEQRAQTVEALEAAQEGFTAGDVELSVVTTRQIEKNSLDSALKKISSDIENLKIQLGETVAAEKRAEVVAELRDICADAVTTAEDFQQAKDAIFDGLEKLALSFLDAREAHLVLRRRFRKIAVNIAPGIDSRNNVGVPELHRDLKATGVDLSGIALQITDLPLRGFDSNEIVEAGPLSPAFNMAITAVAQKWERNREAK